MDPRGLPIYDIEAPLVRAARGERRFIVRAPTGSGKSTQVPQMLLDAGAASGRQIVVLQPRRLAARLLAARVAHERGVPLGGEVGYQVRLDRRARTPRASCTRPRASCCAACSKTPASTTSARCSSTSSTSGTSTATSPSPSPSTCSGGGRTCVLVVMSATLAVEPLRERLAPCAVLASEGRTYPVTIEYLDRAPPANEPAWETAAAAFERLVSGGHEGDVLVFMPGAYEIRRTVDAIRRSRASAGYAVLPLHGELPPGEQDAAVAPGRAAQGHRLDQRGRDVAHHRGRARRDRQRAGAHRALRPHRGINTLLVEKISRASADQRAGRAGRTAPGRCLRLWTAQRPSRPRPRGAAGGAPASTSPRRCCCCTPSARTTRPPSRGSSGPSRAPSRGPRRCCATSARSGRPAA